MADAFVGEIRMIGFNFPPRGWLFCHGQSLPIKNFPKLYLILGTLYGGDGKTYFVLPDLRGRAPLHGGGSTGASGVKFGQESVTLTAEQLPAHTHEVMATVQTANSTDGQGRVLALAQESVYAREAEFGTVQLSSAASGPPPNSGGSKGAHNNMQPYLAVNFIIATG